MLWRVNYERRMKYELGENHDVKKKKKKKKEEGEEE